MSCLVLVKDNKCQGIGGSANAGCMSASVFYVCTLLMSGEKMTEEEMDAVLQGLEDDQGRINYDGEKP